MRFLVCLDDFEPSGSSGEQRLPAAIPEVAQGMGAELVLYHGAPRAEDVDDRRRQLEGLAATLSNISTTVEVQAGDGPQSIVAAAAELDCDVVVVIEPGRGEGGFGKTTKKLLQDCPVPLWMVRASPVGAPARIMAALDVGPRESEVVSPDDDILRMALLFARSVDASVRLHSTWELFGQQLMGGFMRESRETIDLEAEKAKGRHREELESLLRKHDGHGLQIHIDVIRGEPEESIPNALRQHGIDLVVLGNKSRKGLSRLLLGNSAERVLKRLDCSVVALRTNED